MEINQLINHILDGNAVLFLGAGFSRDAINQRNKKMKDANGLSRELCRELDIPEDDDLSGVSDLYLGSKDERDYDVKAQKLITKLQQNFTCKQFSLSQQIIAQQKWIRVYTTNYDDVLETAGEKVDRIYTPMLLSDTVERINCVESVVHMNGYIRNLDKNSLENEFKLCTRSYLIQNLKNSPVFGLFKKDLKEARAIVFIGTSLKYDLDIQQVLFAESDFRNKLIFIDRVADTTDKTIILEDNKKKLLGIVHHIGLDGFADQISNQKKHYFPDEDNFVLRNFERINSKDYAHIPGSRMDTWRLFESGSLERGLVYSHVNDDTYVVRRSIIKDIETSLGKDEFTVQIIHSNLGNGKTCLIEYLMCFFSDKYDVYYFKQLYDDLEQELRIIEKRPGKKVLFIEDYNLYIKVLTSIRYYCNSEWSIVVSCRTYINNNSIYKLCDALGKKIDEIEEYDINYFTSEEKKKIVASLQNVNQADFKDLNEPKALKLLDSKCRNCWSNTVMFIFRSRLIGEKVERVFQNLRKNNSNMEVVMAAIVNNIVGMNLSYGQLLELLQVPQSSISCTRDQDVAELLSIRDGRIEIKSSVLSLYVIRKEKLYAEIIKVMEKMVRNADILLDNDSEMVKRLLISISNISELFYKKLPYYSAEVGNDELHQEILRYFDDVSKVKYYEHNEFFWLQYAMACMTMQEYQYAENHFALAHNYEKKKSNESYQIKVQYGRFLLERAIYEKDERTPYGTLKKANTEWNTVLFNNEAQKFYVYKQMYLYPSYIEVYGRQFTEKEYNNTVKMLENMSITIRKTAYTKHHLKEREQAIKYLEEAQKLLFKTVIKG